MTNAEKEVIASALDIIRPIAESRWKEQDHDTIPGVVDDAIKAIEAVMPSE